MPALLAGGWPIWLPVDSLNARRFQTLGIQSAEDQIATDLDCPTLASELVQKLWKGLQEL